MKHLSLLVVLIFLVSCKLEKEQPKTLQIGTYKALLKINDSIDMPFIFEVLSIDKLQIFNGDEIIEVDEVIYRNDSVFINPPVFEGYIAAKITEKGLEGNYIKDDLNRTVPFKAIFGETERFETVNKAKTDVSGIWETTFSPNSETDKYIAKGIFKQENNKVTGTFRTLTGDYRFLEGVLDGNQLRSEEHTSELQSRENLVCRLLLEKKKQK